MKNTNANGKELKIDVVIDGIEHNLIEDNYFELCFSKAYGWRLWKQIPYQEHPELVGGQYDSKSFKLRINGELIEDAINSATD